MRLPVERTLRLYGWLFAASGAAFVAGAPAVSALLAALAGLVPGAAPVEQARPTFWLVLTGSLMASISQLAFGLSRDASRPLAWRTLLLAKAVSTALFAAFAAAERNVLFLAGAFVDGAILLHLASLCRSAAEEGGQSPSFDAWFLRAREPETGAVLWLRHAGHHGHAPRAELWWTLFDPSRAGVVSGKLVKPEGPTDGLPAADALTRAALRAHDGDDVRWRLKVETGEAPAFRFAPFAFAAGLARTRYTAAAPAARLDGEATIGGRTLRFSRAPASVGNIFGFEGARAWRWLHAELPGVGGSPAGVLEVLSARVPAWPFGWLTGAHLWLDGRHRRSDGLFDLAANGSRREDGLWRFEARLDGVRLRGECGQDEERVARFESEDPLGRLVRVSTSMTGRLALVLGDGPAARRWDLRGAVSVEFGGREA